MGWGLELTGTSFTARAARLGIVDAVRVRHEGERGEDDDYRADAHRVHAELEERGFAGWSDVQRTVARGDRGNTLRAGPRPELHEARHDALVRDEADIVDAQIAFHLHAGVDFVVATDNRSQDGTTEILERYERAGVLHLSGRRETRCARRSG